MPHDGLEAKVFISCGQQQDTDEVDVAHKIREELAEAGFEPYLAVEQHSPRGLRENIFEELDNSEYFVFVDFKRERLEPSNSASHRGSLFCNQELAIASYLDIPIIAFQEEGIEELDGILGALQVNAFPFSDRKLLPTSIAGTVRREWDTHSKNQLRLEPVPVDTHNLWYAHVRVRNLHHRKPARNCYAYLEKAYSVSCDRDISLETTELKWQYVGHPCTTITAKSFRRFDAFWVSKDKKGIRLSTLVDTGEFVDNIITDPGEYHLTYIVISDNFRDARVECRLHIECEGEIVSFGAEQRDGE